MTDNYFKENLTRHEWDMVHKSVILTASEKEELYQAIKARRNKEIREKLEQAEQAALNEGGTNLLKVFVEAVLSD